jgi:hypothetical protein
MSTTPLKRIYLALGFLEAHFLPSNQTCRYLNKIMHLAFEAVVEVYNPMDSKWKDLHLEHINRAHEMFHNQFMNHLRAQKWFLCRFRAPEANAFVGSRAGSPATRQPP